MGRYGAMGASASFLNQVNYLDSLYFLAMGCDEGENPMLPQHLG